MKNWKRYLALALLICFAVTLVPVEAHADALTATMIADLAYGIASGMGINFTAGSATAQGMSDYMTGQVESYVNERGGSLGSLFVGEASISAAGKLLVAQNLYNGVLNFVDWLKDKYTLDSVGKILSDGSLSDIILNEGNKATTEIPTTGYGVAVSGPINFNTSYLSVGYQGITLYKDGLNVSELIQGYNCYFDGSYTLQYVNESLIRLTAVGIEPNYGYTRTFTKLVGIGNGDITNKLSWSVPENWGMPQPLPEDKSMEQTYKGPGFAEPQNLPDFLSKIPAAVADGTLEVEDAIVEAETGGDPPFPSPSPSSSPAPSYDKQGIALLIAEIIAIINSLTGDAAVPEEQIQDVAQQITDTAQTIPDVITQSGTQTQTAVQDATQTITDTITQTQTQTQTAVQDATQTITDTITDTQTEIKDAIQDMTDTQTEIKDAIQDLTNVPDQWEPQKHPLPRGVFPFCIPFDLHDLIVALSAEPQTPEAHVPFDLNLPLPGGRTLPFHYQFDLDLHDFDGLAQILRTLEFIAFGVGLLFVTGKVIKW